MKKRLLTLSLLAIVTLSQVVVIAASKMVQAVEPVTMYFAGQQSSYPTGSRVTVQAKMLQTQYLSNDNMVDGDITYPSNILRLDNASPGRFYTDSISQTGPGRIHFRIYVGSATGDSVLLNLSFTAIGAGNATLNYDDLQIKAINYHQPAVQPANFTVYTPACPSGQVGTPPNCTTPTSPPSPPPPTPTTPPPAPTPVDTCPNIANVQPSVPAGMIKDRNGNCVYPAQSSGSSPAAQTPVQSPTIQGSNPTTGADPQAIDKNVLQNVAVESSIQKTVISWTAPDTTSKYIVKYSDNGEDMIEATATVGTDGTYSVELAGLNPLTKYQFSIYKDSEKEPVYGDLFITRGYPVRIAITDQDKPYDGTFSIDEDQFRTDSDGEALLELRPGKYTLQATSEGRAIRNGEFEVLASGLSDDGTVAPEQSYTFAFTAPSGIGSLMTSNTWALLAVALVTVGGIGGLLLWNYRRKHKQDDYGPALASMTSVYDTPESVLGQSEPQSPDQPEVSQSPEPSEATPADETPPASAYEQPQQPPVNDVATPAPESPLAAVDTVPSNPPDIYAPAAGTETPAQKAAANDNDMGYPDMYLPELEIPPDLSGPGVGAEQPRQAQPSAHNPNLNIEDLPEDMFESARRSGKFSKL